VNRLFWAGAHARVGGGGPIRWTYDAAALERGARLGYELRRQRVAANAVPDFMRTHREWSTHPIGEQPFLWSSADGTVVIPTVDEPSGKRFWIRTWRPGATGAGR